MMTDQTTITVTKQPKFVVEHNETGVSIYHADKGEGIPRHEHEHPHLIACLNGSCVIRKENIEKIIDNESKPIKLVELEWHEIEALENGTVFISIYATELI
jgi:hypothetical protein